MSTASARRLCRLDVCTASILLTVLHRQSPSGFPGKTPRGFLFAPFALRRPALVAGYPDGYRTQHRPRAIHAA